MKNNNIAPIVPAVIYTNADTTKQQILQENQNKSGIYMFKNSINGKRYFGSSDNLKRRFSEYFNINYLESHKYMVICRALLKHGYSNFSLTILEYCEPSKCLEREGYYLKLLKPEYNTAKEPGAPMSGRTHSDESKQKISDALTGKNHSDESKQKISDALTGENHYNFGKTLSDEIKAKISDALTGSKCSDDTRKKISAAQPTSQVIEVFDLQEKTKTTYNSIREAARALNITQSRISMYFKNNQIKPYKGRYIFKKIYG
jgi:group I intron endonuclease